jgi:hypothetical protein
MEPPGSGGGMAPEDNPDNRHNPLGGKGLRRIPPMCRTPPRR